MESVPFGTEYNFGAFTEGRREKNKFFFRGGRGRREKNNFFRGDRRLKVPKLDCGPERTDSILLKVCIFYAARVLLPLVTWLCCGSCIERYAFFTRPRVLLPLLLGYAMDLVLKGMHFYPA